MCDGFDGLGLVFIGWDMHGAMGVENWEVYKTGIIYDTITLSVRFDSLVMHS